MKLLQLNAWGGRLDKSLSKFFTEEKFDIVCLQEIIDFEGQEGSFVSLRRCQAASKLEHLYFSPMFTQRYMKRKASFGNAIISRFPITKSKTVFTHGRYQDDYDIVEHGDNIRNLQHIQIKIEDQLLHVLNHHAYVVHGDKNGNDVTDAQMQLIARYLDNLQGPIILVGDFNLSPLTRSLSFINSRLNNLSIKYKLTTTSTIFSDIPVVRDYIFTNDHVKIRYFGTLDYIVSDHKALILEFEL